MFQQQQYSQDFLQNDKFSIMMHWVKPKPLTPKDHLRRFFEQNINRLRDLPVTHPTMSKYWNSGVMLLPHRSLQPILWNEQLATNTTENKFQRQIHDIFFPILENVTEMQGATESAACDAML